MTTRQDIADALSTFAGIAGSPYRPAVVTSGNAWPQVNSLDHGDGQTYICTWNIYVVGPSDERAFSMWFDTNAFAIADAVEVVAYVESIKPVAINTNQSGDIFALLITARSE